MVKDRIYVDNNWINIENFGCVGLYSPSTNEIMLDYSMKWIVGTNERIPCKKEEIVDEIYKLFK